jgi:U3 small nucleolar RNA-associated protein 11
MLSRKGPTTTGKNRTGTVDGDRGNKVLGQDVVRLYKTQDLGYVRTARNKVAKEVKELEKRAVGIRGRGRKVVFVEDVEEQEERLLEVEGQGGEEMDMDEDEDEDEFPGEDLQAKKLRKLKEKEIEKLESKLDTARERLKALTEAEEALELQRARMAKTPTVGGINKQGVKFKVRERKR